MVDKLINLCDDELLIVICKDNLKRSAIHSYLEIHHPNLGHVGILLDRFDYDRLTYKRCWSCNHLVGMSYHRGIMENNIDEYYSGWCDNCDESVEWECNYDYDCDIIRIIKNNAICIGKTIKINRPYHAKVLNTSSDEITKILTESKTHKIKTIPIWYLTGSQGRKGKRSMNKKKVPLIDHIILNIKCIS